MKSLSHKVCEQKKELELHKHINKKIRKEKLRYKNSKMRDEHNRRLGNNTKRKKQKNK